MFSFKLSPSFVAKYADRPVDWGYKDAAGNALGEIVFMRTYSRLKPDGSKERWHEVCERVINGMYSIQKDHAKLSRIPWSDVKAHRSAEEAYDRLFGLKWTPPGRGLWMMGTPLVMEQRNSAALQNCLTPDTKIITDRGVRTLAELVDTEVRVWAKGDWADATVQSFGVQPVQRVTFAPAGCRSNHRVVETATPNHRWELADGSVTTDLSVGDKVPGAVVSPTTVDEDGYRHGLIFADGTVSYHYANGDYSHMMRLCGPKEAKKNLFDKHHYQPNCNGDPVVYHRSSRNLKDLPTPQDSPAYIGSFIAGWVEFDGSDGIVSTQNQNAADWLLKNAALGGYLVTGHSVETRATNYGPRKALLHKITLRTDSAWVVKSIDPLDEHVEVMCAVVPGIERFTLASGVYTGNCAFVSTADMTKANPSEPFAFLMEASMLGVGVGFDTKGSAKGFVIQAPGKTVVTKVIPDTREGWVESLRDVLDSFLVPNTPAVKFDYSEIRPAGTPIKTFGGVAAGHEPLERLHDSIAGIFSGREGETVTSMDIVDIANLIGVCVISGNVRRSAELAIGTIDDADFLNAKNPEVYPDRNSYNPEAPGWAWASNNSVAVNVGDDLTGIAEGIARNGEPGVLWMDLSRSHGRLADAPDNRDHRVAGYNPCAEQSLESFEMCTLVETYLGRHDTLEDYQRTLKFAYLYGKTVTLLPTHWERTNAIMLRNRRIGTSASGVADFADNRGLPELRRWVDEGYATVQKYDHVYSEWLGVRQSVKTTTVKPSGTVAILAGVSPGVHWAPGGEYFLRRIRFGKNDPMVGLFRRAGYTVEPAAESPADTVVVAFPVRSQARRSEADVSVFEKAHLAALMQRWWSDNSVSVTLSFDSETEGKHVASILGMYEGQLKSVSFLPTGKTTYPQMPYEGITAEEYAAASMIFPVDLSPVYAGGAIDAEGEAFCTTDVCEIKTLA